MEFAKKKTVDKKRVEVRYTGPILPLGGIYGPTVPQIMDVHTIASLLIKGYRTVEILNNGSEVMLDMSNYDLDFNGDGGASVEKIATPNENVQKMPAKKPQKKEPSDEEKKKLEAEKKAKEEEEELRKLEEEEAREKAEAAKKKAEEEKNSGIKVNQAQNNQNQKNNQQSTSKSKADKLVSK